MEIQLHALPFPAATDGYIKYQYDGAVPNILKHENKLYEKNGKRPVHSPIECYHHRQRISDTEYFEPMGSLVTFVPPNKSILQALAQNDLVEMHSFISDKVNEETKTFLLGHEETHLLQDIGKEDLLENYLICRGADTSTFYSLDIETRADIGGFFSAIAKHSGVIMLDSQKWDEKYINWVNKYTKMNFYPPN